MKKIAFALLAFCLIIEVIVSPDLPALATGSPQLLGGMNIDGYCQSQGDTGSSVNASGTWNCNPSGNAVNMSGACQWQYVDSNAFAQQDIPNSPYGWNCYTTGTVNPPATNLGGMDLSAYCTSIGEGQSALNGQTWICNGNGQAINLNAACVFQYSIANAFASQTISNNPYSYACFEPSATPTPTQTPTPTPSP